MGIHGVPNQYEIAAQELESEVRKIISSDFSDISQFVELESGIGMGRIPYVDVRNKQQFNKKIGTIYKAEAIYETLSKQVFFVE